MAAYISSKIDEVFDSMTDKKDTGKLFTSVMKKIWTNRDKKYFFIPKEYTCYSDIKIKFTKEDQSSFNGKIVTISVDSLMRARTKEDIRIAVIIIKSIVYHEVEHFLHTGARLGSGKDKLGSFSKYLTNKGEIRAFARMFSVLYCEIFPGCEFDINNLLSIGRDMGISSIIYYFEVFDMKKFIKRYPFVKGVKKTILRLTIEFIKEYRTYRGIL